MTGDTNMLDCPFMTIDKIRECYGVKSRSTIYRILAEMEACGRYKHAQLRLGRLINRFAIEDFLECRSVLKRSKTAFKNLPPFSMYSARKKRGDIA